MSAWLKLEPIDFAFFVVANLIGYLVGGAIADPTFAAFTCILVAYHVFLLFLVLHSEKEAGISLPIGSTLLTHLACLILIVPVGMTRHLPFFGLFRFGVASFAVFERNWLFSATSSVEPKREEAPVAPVAPCVDAPLWVVALWPVSAVAEGAGPPRWVGDPAPRFSRPGYGRPTKPSVLPLASV